MKSSLIKLFAMVWGAAVLASACGGGDGAKGFNTGGPSMCGTLAPCGGDLVGTWSASVGCVTAAGIREAEGGSCATISVTNVNESGTITFNADMTYSAEALTEQATYQLSAPVSCASGGSCVSAQQGIEATGEFDSVVCTGSTVCSCVAVQTPVVATESGTYTISGSTVTTNPIVGLPSTIAFCVQGTSIHLMATEAMSMGTFGTMVVTEDTVAQKQ